MSIVISPITEEVSIYVDQNTEKVYVEITETAIGIPKGGTTGQVLAKASDTNYDTEWVSGGAGGGAAWGDITGTLTDQTDLQAELNLKVDKVTGKGLSQEDYTTAEKSKLAGIATGATANQTDAYLLARANHTGTQLAATIPDFGTAVSANSDVAANTAARHVHNNFSLLQTITEAFTTVLKTAYDSAVTWISTNGTNILNHIASTANPHNVTKAQVGLGNADNTADADKPISSATQTALNAKEGTITAGTTGQYYRGDKTFQTLDKTAVGLANVDNTSDANKPVSTAAQTALDLKQNIITTSESILGANVSMPSASVWYSGPAITLGVGTWEITAYISITATIGGYGDVRIYNGTAGIVSGSITLIASRTASVGISKIATVSSGTLTFTLQGYNSVATSTMVYQSGLSSQPNATLIYAKKIA